jgi:hypothetical protein
MKRSYLSICAIYLNEADYMREWLEFHRIVGVERFFLYNNRSEDRHLEVLAPYVEDGTVVLHDWPMRPGQSPAYDDCLRNHGAESRWIAFIDIDEFLFSPLQRPLPEVLADYESHPGVAVNWVGFGTSGHRTKPSGLVIENYVRRAKLPLLNRHIKSIVNPVEAVRALSPHWFEYRSGLPVDENFNPVDGPVNDGGSFSRLRLNHYVTKSEEEFRAKIAKPRAEGPPLVGRANEKMHRGKLNEQEDFEITVYAPAVREALRRTEARGGEVPTLPAVN